MATDSDSRQDPARERQALPLAALIGMFTGMVMALQTGNALQDFGMTDQVGPVVGLTLVREMGPVITKESQERIEGLIAKGAQEGANLLVDGRQKKVSGYEDGYFVFPTVLDNVNPTGEIAKTEIFGPVLSLMHANDVDEAIALVNNRAYGNQASIFTSNGSVARKFRHEVDAGNVGINIGVAAPMAYFPFSGWNESFFGDLHAQSRHGVEFYTQTKIVVERWPKEWSRQF